jgi:hypothetical protein
MWKRQEMQENELLNLKYYFDKFDKENKEKQAAVAASKAAGHDTQTV